MIEFGEGHLSLYWAIPFIGILLSLAFFPLLASSFWHRHYGKVIAAWGLLFVVPASRINLSAIVHDISHVLMMEYIPFVLLIGSLFVVTSGIRIRSSWTGNPLSNVGVLFLGSLLASWIGTTGASMLLVRPLLQANAWRRYQSHVFVFFIFLVANIGGALTPLGDPPLFIGFLQGVPFLWPLKYLMAPTFFVIALVLFVFFLVDGFLFRKEDLLPPVFETKHAFKINGRINLLFLGCIVLAVFLSGYVKTGVYCTVFNTPLYLENIARDLLLVFICFLSLKLTRKRVREDNHFTWDPLIEVGKVFLGIFITVLPVIAMLKAGNEGPLSSVFSILSENGTPNNPMYFWFSGFFSSFLDNAPTYLVFFFTAGGDVSALTTTLSKTLTAISLGSVYLGALTYIGNAPNFIVRSIVERQSVKMPSFFPYMGISCLVLLPIIFICICLYL